MAATPEPNPYDAPDLHTDEDAHAQARRFRNPIHTAIFTGLFVVTMLVVTLVGGWIGWLAAPVVGGMLAGLWRLTRPSVKELPGTATTAGSVSCPECGSVQTDRIKFASPGQPNWQCFSCDAQWLAPIEP